MLDVQVGPAGENVSRTTVAVGSEFRELINKIFTPPRSFPSNRVSGLVRGAADLDTLNDVPVHAGVAEGDGAAVLGAHHGGADVVRAVPDNEAGRSASFPRWRRGPAKQHVSTIDVVGGLQRVVRSASPLSARWWHTMRR